MKRRLMAISVMIFWAAAMVSVAAASGGGQGWIDDPLSGTSVAIGPVVVVAHATHPDGVVLVRLDVNGATIAELTPNEAGESLVTVEFLWTPPGSGTYRLEVSGANPAGGWGKPGGITVHVEPGEAPDATTSTSGRSTTTTTTAATTTSAATTSTTPSPTSTTATTTTPSTTTTTLPDGTTTTVEPTTTTTETPRTTTTR